MSHRCAEWGTAHAHRHGTTSGHRYHGCDCPECITAYRAYRRAWEARNRTGSDERRQYNREYFRRRRAADPSWGRGTYTPKSPEKSRERSRRYRERNRDTLRAAAERRRSRSQRIGQGRRWWTPAEDALILQSNLTDIERAYMLKRTPESIAQRRYRLRRGLSESYRYHSDGKCRNGHDLSKVGTYIPKGRWRECCECRRQARARWRERNRDTRSQRIGQGRRWWTPAEDALILQSNLTDIERAYMLKRTPESIAQRRYRLRRGLSESYRYHSDGKCRNGHDLSKVGTYIQKGRWRGCCECRRQAKARWRERAAAKK